MAWVGEPKTWTPDVVTVPEMNTEIRDRMNILKTSVGDDGALIDDTVEATTIVAGVITLNLGAARHFTFSATSNITTTTLQNIPTAGHLAWFTTRHKADGTARTWSWFTGTVIWGGGFVPTRTSTTNKVDWYMFLSVDAGTIWHGFVLDQGF